MVRGQSFEYLLVKAYRTYIDQQGRKAYVYRNKQYKFQDQIFDIYSDSALKNWYFAIECKSVKLNENDVLYWSEYFRSTKGSNQIERETWLLRQTGRLGFLAVEVKRDNGRIDGAYFVPWAVIDYLYNNGYKGIEMKLVMEGGKIDKSGGKYIIDNEFVYRVHRPANIKLEVM